MEKFKGTPGPWEFNKVSGKVSSEHVHCIVDLCNSSTPVHDLDLDDKNGHLIAAAPDLLEALQRCESVLSVIPLEVCDVEDLLYARAAIARALGKNDGEE